MTKYLDRLNRKIELQDELIQVLTNQVMDLTIMSKIELGDDVIAEIRRIKDSLKENEQEF